MENKIIISKANKQMIDFIKAGISDKKEKHKQLLRLVDPSVVRDLQKMSKVEFSHK